MTEVPITHNVKPQPMFVTVGMPPPEEKPGHVIVELGKRRILHLKGYVEQIAPPTART